VILNYFQPPRVFRSSSPSQPKDTVMADGMGPAGSGPLDQGYVDEQRSLEAAVSEGWPSRHTAPEARISGRSNRTGPKIKLRSSFGGVEAPLRGRA
jgi:hypothetical protein